jgi:hypothetical protein
MVVRGESLSGSVAMMQRYINMAAKTVAFELRASGSIHFIVINF